MDAIFKIIELIKSFLIQIGELAFFAGRFFIESFRSPFEFKEFLRQCFCMGNRSLLLFALTGFIIGLVFSLQLRPTLLEFGAVSWMPSMVSISIIREIGPITTALICASRIGSGIGAELGSMRVTEQIDAMEVSGTNPFKYLIDLMPVELSGGMKRRTALARTLILQPKIILYDESNTGLDPITAKEILILMKSIQEKHKTSALIITHDVDCARVISNRMILLVDGINYIEGTFNELSTSTDIKVQAFFK